MIEYEQALKAILHDTKKLSKEKVFIEDSAGRVLAEDVYADLDMPRFNKSAMDGYVLKEIDVRKVPVKLKCIGVIEAGQSFGRIVSRGECVKIMTGACLPKSTNCVVMKEHTQQLGKYVEITKSVNKGQNVCLQGEDIKQGEKVLVKGKVICTSDVALLASVGRRYVEVVGKPKVAILNTGGEIVPVGEKLSGKKIYNSNGPQLLALLKSDNINPCFLGIAKDKPQELKRAIKKGLNADVLLISGGVSVGDYDLVPEILKSLGIKEIFHNVKCKPGKPLFFGRNRNTIVFGIPGNPVANFLAYQIFIRPALLKMSGEKPCEPQFKKGVLKKTFPQNTGRKHFILAKIINSGVNAYVIPLKSHGSADIRTLSRADGFMVIEAGRDVVRAGEKVNFIVWKKT
ncbi:MAG: gephyrin-like molybdotransferase Glp [Candidatus Omnitrophota bacterium]